MLTLVLFTYFFIQAIAQKPGTEEVHPKISWQVCTKSGCTSKQGGIVIDSEWREIVDDSGKQCFHDNDWDRNVCSDEVECSEKCYLNGYNYTQAGVSTSGNAVRLKFLTPTGDIGSRVYLFDESAGTYVNFKPLNKEFTFDVETSTLGCGINGALYYVEMDPDGGTSRFPRNSAGAKYGTGYCDAQCPKDGKFIGNNANIGRKYGSCCFEWDIWEANAYSTQFAAHPCTVNTPAYVCQSDCSQCDTSGCSWNHYKNGDHYLYGPGLNVSTKSKFTVVTQFITDNGQDNGNLLEVRRFYIQNGKITKNNIRVYIEHQWDTLSEDYCDVCPGYSGYKPKGGNPGFTTSFKRGAVLAMSIWTDGSMGWLDSGDAGPCESSPGKDNLIHNYPDAYVEYSNIRFGDIDSTY